MQTSLSDAALIQLFIRGETTSLANETFRVESDLNSVHLMAADGELVATTQKGFQKAAILVNLESKYWDTLKTILSDQGYIPLGSADLKGFTRYEQHAIPADHILHYTEAKELWRTWWIHQRFTSSHSLNLEVLVFMRKGWYPVRTISAKDGTIAVKTWLGEQRLAATDQIPWLSQGKGLANIPNNDNNSADEPSLQELMTALSEANNSQGTESNGHISSESPITPSDPQELAHWLQAVQEQFNGWTEQSTAALARLEEQVQAVKGVAQQVSEESRPAPEVVEIYDTLVTQAQESNLVIKAYLEKLNADLTDLMRFSKETRDTLRSQNKRISTINVQNKDETQHQKLLLRLGWITAIAAGLTFISSFLFLTNLQKSTQNTQDMMERILQQQGL